MPAEGGGTTTNILAGRQLRRLARPEPARDQRGPRAARTTRRCARRAPAQAAADELCSPGGTQASSGGRSPRAGRGQGAQRARAGTDATGGGARRLDGRRRTGGDGGGGPAGRSPTTSSTRSSTCRRGRSTTCPATSATSSAAAPTSSKTAAAAPRPRPPGGAGATDDLLDFLFSADGGRLDNREASAMRGQGPMAALAASPTMVGAVTTLIVIVAVFLAYNANNGPAVRARLPRLGRDPERVAADATTTRSGSAATGSAWSSRSTRCSRTRRRRRPGERHQRRRGADRRRGRAPQPEARQGRRAAARGLGLPGPLPLDLRAQVPRDRPRGGRSGARGLRLRRPRRPDRPGDRLLPARRRALRQRAELAERLLRAADRVRRHQQHLRHAARGPTRAPTWTASATPSPAAAPRSTTRSTASSRCSPGCGRWPGCCWSPTRSCGASSRSSATQPGSWRRSPSSRPTCSPTGRDRLRRDLVRPGGAAGDDLRGPADAADRDRPAAAPAPVPARLRDAQRASCARASTTCGNPARAQRRDRGRHAGAAARPRDTSRRLEGACARSTGSSTQPTTG